MTNRKLSVPAPPAILQINSNSALPNGCTDKRGLAQERDLA